MISGMFNDPSSRVMRTALSGLSQRQQVIANNVANVDTPGYMARDVQFEDALQAAMVRAESAQRRPTLALTVSHQKHLAPVDARQASQSAVQVGFTTEPTLRNDGNTVDIEREMLKLAETQLNYNAMTQLVGGKLTTLRTAINEGRR